MALRDDVRNSSNDQQDMSDEAKEDTPPKRLQLKKIVSKNNMVEDRASLTRPSFMSAIMPPSMGVTYARKLEHESGPAPFVVNRIRRT